MATFGLLFVLCVQPDAFGDRFGALCVIVVDVVYVVLAT